MNSTATADHALSRRRISLTAALLAFAIASAWSFVVSEALFRGDDVTWYHFLVSKTWVSIYFFEPILFLLLSAVSPATFGGYIFWSLTILLGLLLFAFIRMRLPKTDQVILILFFCCSFYGLHFMLNFQRQCLALAFFFIAVGAERRVILSPVLSFLSHHYAIVVHSFWYVRRLSVKAAIALSFAVIPFVYFITVGIQALAGVAAGYEEYGADSFAHLAAKQGINIAFVVLLLITTAATDRHLRSLSAIYLVQCLPTLVWPLYSGFFNRVDYFLFPVLVVLWPRDKTGWRLNIARLAILLYTLASGYWWMKINLGWIVFDRGGAW